MMSSTSTDVVHVQPRQYKPSTGSNQLQRRVDENREEIILEGICAQERLKSHISSYYTALSSLVCFPVCVPLSCLLGKFCGPRAVDVWSMHLTCTGIYFVNFNASCSCCPKSQVYIALSDINDIQEVSYIYTTGCCNYGTKLDSTTVRMELKPSKAKEFFPVYYKCCSSSDDIPLVIDINYCENAAEFVEAVKQQMVTMGL